MRPVDLRKLRSTRPLAQILPAVIQPALSRQGFGQSQILLFWEEVVGERLAAVSRPIKISFPPSRRDHQSEGAASAALIIRVESGFALEMQHLAPIIAERVNANLGWRAIGRISLKQGPIGGNIAPRRAPRRPGEQAQAAAAQLAAGVSEEPLRNALSRLGAWALPDR
ncbi:MAG TPA: DciA family protein [Methylocella sp.]|nr:DciA family protein [Methylocella sp.]